MKSPAFQFYANDWLSSPSVMLMSPAEEGAYIRLLAIDWACDGIPDNDEVLAKLSRLGDEWCKGGYSLVKECFKPHPKKEGYLTNARIESERKKQNDWAKKSSQGGKKSAAKRWGSKDKEDDKGGYNVVKDCLPPFGNSSSSSSSSNKRERESDTLSNRPKSKEEVIAYSKSPACPMPSEFVEWFFDAMESSAWRLATGNPCEDWKAAFRSMARSWRSKPYKDSNFQKPKAPEIKIKTQAEYDEEERLLKIQIREQEEKKNAIR